MGILEKISFQWFLFVSDKFINLMKLAYSNQITLH